MDIDFSSLVTLDTNGRIELVRARRTGASVLLKRCREEGTIGDVLALRRECAIGASLSGSASLLPRMLDGPTTAMIIMDDPGGDLLARRVGPAALAAEEGLAIGEQIALALGELHARGMVHNGVRPQAILYRPSDRRAWLADFADAGGSRMHPVSTATAGALAERLVYISPEQTGRLEIVVDRRSDLYSLGVVLYELLTGAPPFRSDDPLEQIHWHIAGVARPPAEIDPAIPPVLSDLVLRLLAKAPDERYQSARVLAQDLAACARSWAQHRHIARFALGRGDLGDRLAISPRLYGREHEVHILRQALDEVCQGRGGNTLLLVEGYSGIGKTALMQQLYRPIARQKGYFIAGKFDQIARGMPFGALIQAFRTLVRQLLGESEAGLAAHREALLAALGSNCGVLTAVIPELEFIVGAQPAPVQVDGLEAQNRFQRVLQNFLAVLARPEHPLVLLLDDLQWADAATLGLLAPLLTSPDIRGMMLMGGYRDNELDASPQLAHALTALASNGVLLKRIALGPLHLPDLTRMLADTLHSSGADAAPLARLIRQKTGGNPFFVIQFLKLLERDGHLRFDAQQSCWTYDIEQIAGLPLSDDVVDLMTLKIRRLPPKSEYALTLAACIGNRFDCRTLAFVIRQSRDATAVDLEPAIEQGLVVRAAPSFEEFGGQGFDEQQTYAFLHDRVQQSAYALIPPDRRQMVHLTVGRLLRSRLAPAETGAALFEVVHHLNLGRDLIEPPAERRELAQLNLAAGRRAKSSTAHDSALRLFSAGLDLLGAADWKSDYELCFELKLEAAESQYLCGHIESALSTLDELARQAATDIDLARIARLRSVQFENLARYSNALASARDGLARLGVMFADDETGKLAALGREIAQIDALRAGRAIAALVELPAMSDPRVRMVMVILTDIWSAAYILGDATLARLISATMVRLSLAHGNVGESAYGYVTHAITVGPLRGEYAAAYEFGRLALAVNRRFDDMRRRAKIYQQFQAHVNFWRQPFRTCREYAREACRSGLESGDFLYAAYGAGTEPWAAILATQDLAQFVVDFSPSIGLIEKLKNTGFADSVRLMLNWARALQGRTAGPLSLTDPSLDEEAYARAYRDNPFFAGIHAVLRLHLCALLGNPAEALQAARSAAALVPHLPGTVWPLLCDFWRGIALARHLDAASGDDRPAALEELRAVQRGFEALSDHCPENFRSQAAILGAEIARIEGRERDAIECYTAAIEFTATRPLLPYRALAHEMLGRLHLHRTENTMAAVHLEQARRCYARWGAAAKAGALQRQYPAPEEVPAMTANAASPLLDGPPGAAAAADRAGADPADGLDLFSVLKATQAIAAQTSLAELLARLLQIAVENAGAERGALVLESDSGPLAYTKAAASDGVAAEEDGVDLERSTRVPAGVVNYVRRTGEALVLTLAQMDEQHGADPYLAAHRPRSVACIPVQTQGRTIGVLYLEHRRADAVFTAHRLRTLRIISTQAAISLQGARLLDGLKREIAERQRAQEQLGSALAEVERFRDALEAENSFLRRDLIANVSHDLRTPLASMRGYLELLTTQGATLDAAQREQYLGIAMRQSERLANLIDELFELAKLDFKGMALNREPFCFGDLVSDVLQKLQLAATERRVALHVEALPRQHFVHADLGLMERVLENLVGNAIRHTPADGRVSVRLQADAERLMVEVADTGHGIASSELPFIFDRFYRGANSRARGSGGAGLGLAITKRILELHGASIEVQSERGSGTRFRFGLPLHPPASAGD